MLEIPFFPNTVDDLHCYQACLRSILKFTFPQKNYSFRYLDRKTHHKKGMGTWNSAAYLFLSNLGFDVVSIETFNYRKFSKLGERYLRSLWTDETFQFQRQYSDFQSEQNFAKRMLRNKRITLLNRAARKSDLRLLFRRGYILIGKVNPYVLDGKRGYAAHSVVVSDMEQNFVRFHDPGLPPKKNRKVSFQRFFQAMAYPNAASADLRAVRFIGRK